MPDLTFIYLIITHSQSQYVMHLIEMSHMSEILENEYYT